MLNTIRENAKWFVAVPIVCFGALIFVDWGMSPGNSMTQQNNIGKVDGEKISLDAFNREVDAAAKQMPNKELDAEQHADLRTGVFEKFVRQYLVVKDFETYGLAGSGIEILTYLKNNPPPGVEKEAIFMGPDSQFSQAKYLQWLSNPKAFDNPYMQALEEQLSRTELAEKQMLHLIAMAQPVSDLEFRFRARIDASNVWGRVLYGGTDSFAVDASKLGDAELRKWFDAHPDSLWNSKPSTRVAYITLKKQPSAADSQYARDQIDSVVTLARAGEKFDDLARNYSEDPGSAKQGGDLGGYQNLKQWVPEFGNAARTLDSGKISDPVRSSFGWHAILSKGRKIEGGDTLYSLAHVLITVQTSPETIDSLKAAAEDFRKDVKAGKTFAEAAAKRKLTIDSSDLIVQGEKTRLSSGFVPGVSAFAFNADESVSEVLENNQAVHVLARGAAFAAGRDFERSKNEIRKLLAQEKSLELAKGWMASVTPKAAACDTSTECLNGLGKGLHAMSLTNRPLNMFVDGFGYSSHQLLRLWKSSKPRQWTAPASGKEMVMMLRVDSSVVAGDSAASKMVADGRRVMIRLRERGAYQNWYNWRKAQAKVENHLDRYFRD